MKRVFTVVAAFAGLFLSSQASGQTGPPTVMLPAQVVESQPLRDGHDDSKKDDKKVHKPKPVKKNNKHVGEDEALQTSVGSKKKIDFGPGYPGVGASGVAPADANMAVGPNHILQTVNSRYAIYNKSGVLLVGPNSLSSLWAPLGSGNGCATNNSGDVVAQYDRLADRFIVTQLGGTAAPPFSECIAISKTSDPAGAYWLYSYDYGNVLNDYPKFGVWPTATNSAYLGTYNLFANGNTFTGAQLCAYDRIKMLAGNPTAQAICYTINGDGNYLPSDLDGARPPVDGTPGYFLTYESPNSLRVYALSPNFANPSASTLTVESPDITVAGFTGACTPTDTCIPQSGTNQRLDALGDRPMYRLAFRNFGDHEAMVVNHSVAVGSSVGVRWYELRAPVSASAAFTLFQQGTFAPDSTYRWMGSAAMDGAGDIAIGYSASSSAIHPAIRITGRVPGDPLGTLQPETSLLEGTGSQTGGLSRWGDYTSLRIDPADDCTFWYTNEYLQTDGSFNWRTFFGPFKFASCTPSPDFSIAAAPSSLILTQGQPGTSTVTVTAQNGFSGSVGLTVTGCPSGATCSLPTPVTPAPTATSTLTVSTTAGTSTGTFTLTITGTSGSLSHATTVMLTVNPSGGGTSATFVRTDTTTQGTWRGVYGGQGYGVINDTISYPSYAQVAITGAATFTWAASTTNVRALQKAAGSDRLAACWYAGGNFSMDVNLTDGASHQVALYLLDWDSTTRAERVDVLDAVSGAVLDTRSMSGFASGQFLVWNLSGHVTLRVTNTGPINAVVSGIFFDAVGASSFPTVALTNPPDGASYTAPATIPLGATATASSGRTIDHVDFLNGTTVIGTVNQSPYNALWTNVPAGVYTLTARATDSASVMATSTSRTATVTASGGAGTSATFVRSDTTTQGTWRGVYGAQGYGVINDTISYPSYAQVAITGAATFTWAASTTNVRALQKATVNDRLAACWYSGGNFTIDVDVLDGATHQVALYLLDWDTTSRVERVDVLNAVSGAVLDTRTVSGFAGGQYLVWNLSGHVTLRITNTGPVNAVVSGIFFDAAGASTSPTVTLTNPPDGASYTAPATIPLSATATASSGRTVDHIDFLNGTTVIGTDTQSPYDASWTNVPAGVYTLTARVTDSTGEMVTSAARTVTVMASGAGTSATFVRTDTATQGTWKGVYGSQGYGVINDTISYPSYAQVAVTGAATYTWAASTTSVRALQRATVNDRLAACWYSGANFTMDVNLIDGLTHQVALYFLDWDSTTRAERIDVLNAATGAVLDTRTVSGFANGQYLVWTVSGHVTLRITNNTGSVNAVVSGLFFD